jgi:L-lactate dehydrogenase complex protein LldG
MSNSRESILEKIRKAKAAGATSDLAVELTPEEASASVFVAPVGDLSENFKAEIEKISGSCFIVADYVSITSKLEELLKAENVSQVLCMESEISEKIHGHDFQLTNDISVVSTCAATITGCEFIISRTGSVMVSNGNTSGRRPHVAPDVHIVIANQKQVVADLENAIEGMLEKYSGKLPSWVSNITGPSRTADIEKTLILGAHGPKKLIVFIIKA